MSPLEAFFDLSATSLKVCGVTTREDAFRLAEMGVPALGVNFWPHSKRYAAPETTAWLAELAGKIIRVGVFVNPDPEEALRLAAAGLIDVVQLHGNESPKDAAVFLERNIPLIKAIGVKESENAGDPRDFRAAAILLDTYAPGVYGGTGQAFDWNRALAFKAAFPEIPVILAGGITPENSRAAAELVRPAVLDVASGAEISPGMKDIAKVAALLSSLA